LPAEAEQARGSIRVGAAAGDTQNDDKMPIGMNLEEDAPCAHSATKCPVRSFEKLDVAAVWVGAHVFEGGVDVLHVGTRHVA